ncbi:MULTISPECIES: PKD domain-containing protein [Aquimarina]|uniref:PKD domain-containing protein n=1 Tax=Aquimarina TaxID=290174 RepID=UPI000943FC66|nr:MULTISPECIES: PKD domain-containing protein [Aquimarina]
MRILFLSFLLIVGTIAIGQESTSPNPLEEALQVFPVSPEAASLGKYGDIPVNLSTGKINYTVPVYTIKVGDFEWPIHLSYNYGGLITEQDHPMTGMGWDLIANGRITRQIRGKDDEYGDQSYKANAIIPFLQTVYDQGTPIDEYDTNKRFEIYNNIANRNYDAQQDKYVISAPGLSGSYVHDEKGDIVFMEHRNFKVNKTNNTIIITKDNGVTYYFEIHEIGSYAYKTSIEGESLNRNVPMSFLLTRIKLNDSKGSIYFEYSPTESYSKRVYSESRTKDTSVGGTASIEEDYTDNSTTRHQLQKIIFPNGEVRFDITSGVLDQEVSVQTLNEISVWNTGKQIIKYNFTYNDPTKNRKTLVGITKSNGNTNLPWYQFEYYPFPNTLGPSVNYKYQDPWGYYNGNSGSLLSLENRKIDHNKTLSGALKKITYPTKGYSLISYEQNRVPPTSPGLADFYTYTRNKTFSSDNKAGQGVTKTIDTTFTVPSYQIIEVSLSAGMFLYDPDNPDVTPNIGLQGAEASIKVEWLNPPLPYLSNLGEINITGEDTEAQCEPLVGCSDSYYKTNPVVFRAVPKGAIIRITGSIYAPTKRDVYANCSIKYEELVNEAGELFSYVGGVRVSGTEDCDNNGNCKTTHYKYVLEDGIDSGLLTGSSPVFRYSTKYYDGINADITRIHTVSNSMRNFTSYQGAPVLYRRVETIVNGGDNGKEVNYYTVARNNYTNFPFITTMNNDWKKGQLLKKEVHKKENGKFVLEKETINQYQEFYPYGKGMHSSVKAYGMAVGRHYISSSYGNPHHFKDNYYIDYPKEYKLIKTIHREFLHEQTLTRETSYAYDTPYGQLKTQTDIGSHNNTMVTEFLYPYDLSNTVHNSLIAQNRIAIPIQTQTKEDDKFVATQSIAFKDWGDGKLLPELIKTLKGEESAVNVFQDQVEYLSYDHQGYPLEVSQVDGRHIMYVWGYNNTLPIVKIDNASYTGISSTASSLITQLQTASNTEDTEAEEATMRNLFKSLRDDAYFADAQVTGYTYDPLVGVTSITDPKGHKAYYKYDEFNRLMYGLDNDQHIAQQVRYNYQGEQTATLGDVTIDLPGSNTIQLNQSATFSASITGNGGDLYTWSVNGVQEQCDGTTSFTKTFNTTGTYTISVLVYNSQTKHRVSKTMSVVVEYPPIHVPTVSANHDHVVKGTNVDFSASGIGGGSGNLRYEWYANNVKQASTTTTFRYTTNTVGTNNVYFKVIDNETGKSVSSPPKSLHVYSSLVTPAVHANKIHSIEGNTINFTTNGITGGSGSRRYEWYVNNAIQSATATSYSKAFSTDGTYTIKFRVIDTKTGQFVDSTRTIYVYNPLNTGSISVPSTIAVNTTATFNINPSEAGGSYTYLWTVTSNWKTYTSSAKSFGLLMNYDYYGTNIRVTCKVSATKTGVSKTVSKTITVNGAPTLGGSFSKSTIHNNQYHQDYMITAVPSNGSGHYSYSWYRDGVAVRNNPYGPTGIMVELNCDNKSDRIKCVIRDQRTQKSKTVEVTYNFTRSCGGGDVPH